MSRTPLEAALVKDTDERIATCKAKRKWIHAEMRALRMDEATKRSMLRSLQLEQFLLGLFRLRIIGTARMLRRLGKL